MRRSVSASLARRRYLPAIATSTNYSKIVSEPFSKTIKIQKYDPQGAVVACLPACVLRELWKVGKLNTIIIAHATGLAQVLPKTTAMHMHVYAQQQHEVLMLSRITKNTMRAKTHHGESTDMHMHGYAQQYEVLMLSRITKKIHGEQKNMN